MQEDHPDTASRTNRYSRGCPDVKGPFIKVYARTSFFQWWWHTEYKRTEDMTLDSYFGSFLKQSYTDCQKCDDDDNIVVGPRKKVVKFKPTDTKNCIQD